MKPRIDILAILDVCLEKDDAYVGMHHRQQAAGEKIVPMHEIPALAID